MPPSKLDKAAKTAEKKFEKMRKTLKQEKAAVKTAWKQQQASTKVIRNGAKRIEATEKKLQNEFVMRLKKHLKSLTAIRKKEDGTYGCEPHQTFSMESIDLELYQYLRGLEAAIQGAGSNTNDEEQDSDMVDHDGDEEDAEEEEDSDEESALGDGGGVAADEEGVHEQPADARIQAATSAASWCVEKGADAFNGKARSDEEHTFTIGREMAKAIFKKSNVTGGNFFASVKRESRIDEIEFTYDGSASTLTVKCLLSVHEG